jgi:hypothetical protein
MKVWHFLGSPTSPSSTRWAGRCEATGAVLSAFVLFVLAVLFAQIVGWLFRTG